MKDKMLLPNFYGIFEVKSLTKNRLRIEIDKLKNNREEINELTENLKKISVIKNFKIIQSLGSLTVEFDDSQIDSQFMLGIILKLLNLDEELLKDRKGKIKDTFLNLGKLADITVYNKTKGLFDAKTLAGTMLLIYGIKKLKNEMFLPSGATLIWWSYRLLSKKGN
ncbi:HMA2 domain-containing protein [Fusobacterium polymorphum]|uniref:HMA2 domain-containing protein n=1 Tax=Fusobacterium nucleatum subsp. polymorphum TaxID=76857 RepID=UPI00300A06A0